MANITQTDFQELIHKIENRKILLPDFQREFVWKEEELQKKIVASVLTKMPIGSILLLSSTADEYSSKQLGINRTVDTDDIKGEVYYLLDGQQRVTVLSNVFSSVIHDNCSGVSELNSPALKRRFFLRIPKWKYINEEQDLFGIGKFSFPYLNPRNEVPHFLTADILPFIEIRTFLASDNLPYNPKVKLGTELDDFCLSAEKVYYIPLFLVVPTGKKQDKISLRYRTIMRKIATNIKDEILNAVVDAGEDNQTQIIESIFSDPDDRLEIMDDKKILEDKLVELAENWSDRFVEYLTSCISLMELNQIVVSSSQRERAIDIYENLKRGGVRLSTFDLIMARVAKVSKKNFYERITTYLQKTKVYAEDVIPDKVCIELKKAPYYKSYNATLNTMCYNKNKNEITSKYIDTMLDVFGLYCVNEHLDPEFFKLDQIKRDAILRLNPQSINENCEKVLDAIDKALFFFQTRCGIRSIQEINYSLMLVLVSVVFLKEEHYQKKDVHDLLEAWYFSVIFSGEYDRDQNVTMLNNLRDIYLTISGKKDIVWLNSIKNHVLAMPNFSDKDLLVMKKAETEERVPKQILRNFICQYLMAKTYPDMFESKKTVSVFSDDAANLEAHHIIPLGSVKKYDESSAVLRKKDKHVCNSPINFVLITKSANLAISSKSLDDYVGCLNSKAKSALNLTNYTSIAAFSTDDKVERFLDSRFDWLLGDIINHIDTLLANWQG